MQHHRSISVVVPTRDRPDALGRCLAAVGAQSVAVEVVVVDDGSEPAAARRIRELAPAARARLVAGAGAGPATARNAGARVCRGDVILFTDDDCEPEPEWAEALTAACPAGGSAAGGTVVSMAGGRVARASQLLTSELQRASLRSDGRLGFAPTSNLAMSRELFERLPFDEAYPLAAGEDRAWCCAATALGAAPVYAPEAVVCHRPALGVRGFWRQQVGYGRGAALYHRAGGALAGPGVRRRLLRAGLREGAAVGALVLVAQLAVATGYALETLRGRGAPTAPNGRRGALTPPNVPE